MNIERLGLGCMGMSNRKNPEESVKTIRKALEEGVTTFNTGEFYNAGESEMIVGEALRSVPRDSYFMSVKFGVLPKTGGGIYGLDVNPFNIKGHLAYSLARLGMDYVDLYQPARMDTEIPVEEVVGEISKLVEEGYVRHIGLTMVDAETLRRACRVHPIHTVEMAYSLVERSIENELIDAARELGVKVLAFGTIGHGLFADNAPDKLSSRFSVAHGTAGTDNMENTIEVINELKQISAKKGISLSQLALAWSLSKYDNIQSLVGTANPEHLMSAVQALNVEFTRDEIEKIESVVTSGKLSGGRMRNFHFTNGRITL